jgi:hypothetical protein
MKKGIACIVLTAAMALGGCGLLDLDDGATVTLPPVEYAFELNADLAKAQLQAQLQAMGAPYNLIDLTNQTEIPAQVCPTPSTCQAVPRIQRDLTFDLPAQQVDLTSQTELQQYIAAGKVKKVNIDYIEYTLDRNSLNFELPQLELYVDDPGQTQLRDGSNKVARIAAIPAGATGTDRVQFTVDGRQKMSDRLLRDFAFAFLGQAELGFDTDVTRTIPGGQLAGKVSVVLSFKVDPL